MHQSQHEVRISLRVQPGASKNEVLGLANSIWKIRIAAPPVEGKANKELIEYLSEILDIAKSRIRVVKGEKGRDKVVSISGLTADEIAVRLDRKP